jgi:hypothetical protein
LWQATMSTLTWLTPPSVCRLPSPFPWLHNGESITHFHLVPRLRMHGAVLTLLLVFIVWCWGTNKLYTRTKTRNNQFTRKIIK